MHCCLENISDPDADVAHDASPPASAPLVYIPRTRRGGKRERGEERGRACFLSLRVRVSWEAMAAIRVKGTVKWFNDTKGFGFITPEDGGEDLFVHQSSIKSDGFRTLAEGEAVEFSIAEGDDGRTKAVDVTGPDGASVQGGSGGGGGRRDGYGGGSRSSGSRGYGGNFGFNGGGNRSDWRGGGGGGGGGGYGYGGGGYGGGAACYNCGETGHIARECNQGGGGGGGRYGGGGGGRYGGGGGGRYGGGGGGGGGGTCYNCGEAGHFARECPSTK